MNPLQIAQAVVDEGWKVDVVDMDGVEKAGMDVSHSIACDVLMGKCTDDGWAKHHENETIYNNGAEEGHIITELTTEEKMAAERLFAARDCAYRKTLTSANNFRIIRNSSLFANCKQTGSSEAVYQQMLDVELIFRGLLSQVKCEGNKVKFDNMPRSVDEVLSGKYNKETGYTGGGGGKKFLWFLTLVGVAGAAYMAHKHPQEASELVNRTIVTARELKIDDVVNGVKGAALTVSSIVRSGMQKHRHSVIPGEAEMEAMPVRSTGMSEML
jgi:hypothetical protein